MARRIPLAWLNLIHDKWRFAWSVAGVGFAVLLMLVELGFWYALLDSTVELIRRLDADLFLINRTKYSLSIEESFPRPRLAQAVAVAGVESASPLYLRYARAFWKNRDHPDPNPPAVWPIRILAVPAGRVAALFRDAPDVAAYAPLLKQSDTMLFDVKSKRFYDVIALRLLDRPGPYDIPRELNGTTVHVVGKFSLGTDFSTDGTVLMSTQTLLRVLPGDYPLDTVEIGLILLKPGADPRAAADALRAALPDDVLVLTRAALIRREMLFWQSSTPTGFIFTLGLIMGFVVGVVICYQILSTDVADHLPEYATLKAIGYTDRYLTGVVMREGLLLAVLGYLPALALSWLLYRVLAGWTGLPLELTPGRGGFILLMTIAMCAVSGFLALRRVRAADPAEVFG